jgi:hypothetical protein
MDSIDLKQALSLLETFASEPRKALESRAAVVAYTYLHTLQHHWPSRSNAEIQELLAHFAFIKDAERSRFLKQRRILSRKIARALETA